MSRSQVEPSVAAGWRAWPTQIGRAVLGLRGLRGAAPVQTLYVSPPPPAPDHDVSAASAMHEGRAVPIVQAWPDGGFGRAQTFPSFDAWCAANPGAPARLCVSAHLLHGLVVDPTLALGLALADDTALRGYARQQFSHYHGDAAQGWPLATWALGSGSTRSTRSNLSLGACALHSLDLDALRASAARHGVRLRSVAPVALAGLASLTRQQPSFAHAGRRALALVEGRLLTWLLVDGGRIVGWQQRFLEAPNSAALAQLLAQLLSESSATPLVEPPRVVAWGLDDNDNNTDTDTDSDSDSAACGRWVHDALDARLS